MGVPKPPSSLKAKDRNKWILEAALNVCSRKIDLVIQTETETWILEVKIRLNPKAIGQVMSYRELYKLTFPEDKRRLRLGIVCEVDDPLIRRVAEAEGIKIFIQPKSS